MDLIPWPPALEAEALTSSAMENLFCCSLLGWYLFLLHSPALSVGFTILGEIFAYVIIF